jgi:hypothetical protein
MRRAPPRPRPRPRPAGGSGRRRGFWELRELHTVPGQTASTEAGSTRLSSLSVWNRGVTPSGESQQRLGAGEEGGTPEFSREHLQGSAEQSRARRGARLWRAP